MSRAAFISRLPSLVRFADIADPERFVPAPDDFHLFCCDVVNSTGAIAEGRYKAVNMAGAACIIAAANAADTSELAYVFGGDGASILVPPSCLSRVTEALSRTRRLIRSDFGLEMRLGSVSVAALRARNADLRVAMLELSPGNRLAMFSGGGAAVAEHLIKGADSGRWLLPETDDDQEPPDLDGLSCRWEALEARQGVMLCLLAAARPADAASQVRIYRELIATIDGILAPDTAAAAPIHAENLRFRWPSRGLGLEASATCGTRPRWAKLLTIAGESLVQGIATWSRLKIGNYDAPRYVEELRANADYRRFDDVLRLVLDLSPDQHQALAEALAERHRRGEIVYGLHASQKALMTCLLFDLKSSRHLHLIDGWDGGFTLAARAMKAQLRR